MDVFTEEEAAALEALLDKREQTRAKQIEEAGGKPRNYMLRNMSATGFKTILATIKARRKPEPEKTTPPPDATA